MYKTFIFEGTSTGALTIQQLLSRASAFGSCCFLDNLSYESALHQYDFLLGAGEITSLTLEQADDFSGLDAFLKVNSGRWVFGHISYELSKTIHGIISHKPDSIGFPILHFFVPEVCFRKVETGIEMIIQGEQHEIDYWVNFFSSPDAFTSPGACHTHQHRLIHPTLGACHTHQIQGLAPIHLQPKLSREEYTGIIERLRQHILRGDCYEINFCQEFFAENVSVSPVELYQALANQSPNPFSCYYRHENAHLMCASPERYITRRGNKLISQPIKGTAPRHLGDPDADAAEALSLRNSPKEVSENVMVVDLVRNDLSRVCQTGSVQVDELFGIYSYPQVHQMISTISGELSPDTSFSDILKATFPMGSMTGAPKLRVMELIEQYEPSCRGLFSGSVGYIAPSGDFDFNVVIRSILYNQESRYLSYQVGSGITWYCNPENEYEECLWKAGAIRKVLEV